MSESKHTHWFAVHSVTGVHIGLWQDGKVAQEVLSEYPGGTITELVDLTPIVAAAPDMLEALKEAEDHLLWAKATLDDAGRRSVGEAMDKCVTETRIAIAKATGASNA